MKLGSTLKGSVKVYLRLVERDHRANPAEEFGATIVVLGKSQMGCFCDNAGVGEAEVISAVSCCEGRGGVHVCDELAIVHQVDRDVSGRQQNDLEVLRRDRNNDLEDVD